MLKSCSTGTEIPFTDPVLECADVLRFLLRLAGDHPYDLIHGAECDDILNLIRLAGKYDCENVMRMIKLYIRDDLAVGEMDLHYAFYYACALDDIDNAARLLPKAAVSMWDEEKSPHTISVPGVKAVTTECCEEASVMSANHMSDLWIDRLPRRYWLALLRACRLRSDIPAGSWKAVGTEFRRLLKTGGMFVFFAA